MGELDLADRISQDRFLEILRYLHSADNSTWPDDPNYNKLQKEQPVTNLFENIYGKNINKEVSVDETMIPFKQHMTNQERNQSPGTSQYKHTDYMYMHISNIDVHKKD